MSVAFIRQRLLALHGAASAYAFLDPAWRYLTAVPHDPEVAAAAVDCCLRLGLGGPARELLQARADLSPAAAPQWHAAAREAPSGRVAWSRFQRRYRENLEQLLRGQPHLQGCGPELDRAVRGVHLYRTIDGCPLLSRKRAGGTREWLAGIRDARLDDEFKVPDLPYGTPLYLDGLSLGPLLEQVYDQTARVGLNQTLALFVVDRQWSNLAAWLHLLDRPDLLADPRLYVFAGPQALAALHGCLDQRHDLGTAPGCVIQAPGNGGAKAELEALHGRVQQDRLTQLQDIRTHLARRYAARSEEDYERRLLAGGTVLGVTSRATTMLQYSMRDIGHTLRRFGYTFQLLIEASDHHALTALSIARALQEHDPVLVVMIDHLRYEQVDLFYNVPMLTWIQDPLPNLMCAQAGASIGPADFVCGYFGHQCRDHHGYPPEQFFDCVLPVSERVFHDAPVSDEIRRAHDCDLMYVGHMSYSMEHCRQEWLERCPGVLHPLLERLYGEVSAMLQHGRHILTAHAELVRRCAAAVGVRLPAEQVGNLADNYTYRLFDIGYRHQTLQWAAAWAERRGRRLRIYGRGWEQHPTLARFAAGPLEHGEPLRRAYRCARLVLQTMPSGFQHQRTYEALCCGALVLARYCPRDFVLTHDDGSYDVLPEAEYRRRQDLGERVEGAGRLFGNLEDLLFRDAAGLDRLAEQSLRDHERRDRMQRACVAVVREHHTYAVVLGTVLGRIKEVLGRRPAAQPA